MTGEKKITQNESDPIRRFQQLYEIVLQNDISEPSAVILATATPDGQPSARVVLLKGCDDRGFVFYTNLESRKAMELRANPHATLCFYWEQIQYQVRVEGQVELVPDRDADAYFAARPRGSQIAAWASRQSSKLSSRSELEARFDEYEKKFAGQKVPRPDFWSGFRLLHDRVEFWHRRENRLHERTVYTRTGDGWDLNFLYP